MVDVTYYVALPFLQDDTGSLVAGDGEEFQSPSAAIHRAEVLSRTAGNIRAVAFSRTGDPSIGEFTDAIILRKFGDVPNRSTALVSPIQTTLESIAGHRPLGGFGNFRKCGNDQ
jgi:hypothetical protein